MKNYVKVGRYNQVQLLLLQDQIEQAQLTADTYERQYQAALKRLAVAIEKPVTNVPDAATFNEESLRVISDSGDNPPCEDHVAGIFGVQFARPVVWVVPRQFAEAVQDAGGADLEHPAR